MFQSKLFPIALFSAFLWLFTTTTLHADSHSPQWWKTCPNTESANYRPDQAVTMHDEKLLIYNPTSGDVLMTLDSNFVSIRSRMNIFWTENCRYIITKNVWMPDEAEYYPARVSSMYDTFTGQRIARWGRDEYLNFVYSPTREQFIMRRIDGVYLMSERVVAPVLLRSSYGIGRSLRQYTWDMVNETFIVIFNGNAGYVQIFDLWTGVERAAITSSPGCQSPLNFTIAENNRQVIAYSMAGRSFTNSCVTVYNRDDGAVYSVPTGEATGATRDSFAVSPDGRYLVLGWNALRVWDLHALPEDFAAREPIYRHEGPLKVIRELRFVDHTTVETISVEGVQRWNILTGEQIEDF